MIALRRRVHPFGEPEIVSDDVRKAARVAAFQALNAAEAEHEKRLAEISARITKAERILAPIENARRDLAAAKAELQDAEGTLYRARDRAAAAATRNAPTALVDTLQRLGESQRASLAFDFSGVDLAVARRQNERAAAVVALQREIRTAIQGPLTAEQVADLVSRAKTALFQ